MPDNPCEREPEVLEIVGTGIAHDAWDGNLRAHVAACRSCSELVEIAGALLDDRRALICESRLPQSGAVWFRIKMREREDATRAASRFAWTIQAMLVAAALVVAFLLLGPKAAPLDVMSVVDSLRAAIIEAMLPRAALATLVLLAPVAVYFAVTEE